jgi:hypothetical protein
MLKIAGTPLVRDKGAIVRYLHCLLVYRASVGLPTEEVTRELLGYAIKQHLPELELTQDKIAEVLAQLPTLINLIYGLPPQIPPKPLANNEPSEVSPEQTDNLPIVVEVGEGAG